MPSNPEKSYNTITIHSVLLSQHFRPFNIAGLSPPTLRLPDLPPVSHLLTLHEIPSVFAPFPAFRLNALPSPAFPETTDYRIVICPSSYPPLHATHGDTR